MKLNVRCRNARRCANSLSVPIGLAHWSARRGMFLYFLNRFPRFTALADLHSRAWDDIQSSARQNKVVCLSESSESGRWKKGITKVLSQQIYSGILTMDYEGMYLVHEIFLCSREQKARCVTIIYRLVPKRLPTIELI